MLVGQPLFAKIEAQSLSNKINSSQTVMTNQQFWLLVRYLVRIILGQKNNQKFRTGPKIVLIWFGPGFDPNLMNIIKNQTGFESFFSFPGYGPDRKKNSPESNQHLFQEVGPVRTCKRGSDIQYCLIVHAFDDLEKSLYPGVTYGTPSSFKFQKNN